MLNRAIMGCLILGAILSRDANAQMSSANTSERRPHVAVVVREELLEVQFRLTDPRLVTPNSPLLSDNFQLTPNHSYSWGNPKDHRWEGFAFGAGAMGIMIAMLVHDSCSHSVADQHCGLSTFGGFLMGGTVGGVIGGFIGRSIPRKHDASAR